MWFTCNVFVNVKVKKNNVTLFILFVYLFFIKTLYYFINLKLYTIICTNYSYIIII